MVVRGRGGGGGSNNAALCMTQRPVGMEQQKGNGHPPFWKKKEIAVEFRWEGGIHSLFSSPAISPDRDGLIHPLGEEEEEERKGGGRRKGGKGEKCFSSCETPTGGEDDDI